MIQKISPEEIYKEFGSMVSSIARRMLFNKEEARDAAQEVWYEILKSLPTFRGESKISTWIYSIAKRVVMNYAKKEIFITTKMRNAFMNLDEIPCPKEDRQEKIAWVKEQCDNCLTASLHCLTNEDRLCKLLRDIGQLSYHEIAGILGKEESAVRKMISRARKKIGNFYKKDCVIFNPNGNCRCRIKKGAIEINLPEIYSKIKTAMEKIYSFRKMNQIPEIKNYWDQLVKS